MADLLAITGYEPFSLHRGQRVLGNVVSKSEDELLIDIGAKSEGIVYGREFEAVKDLAANLAVGDPIEASILLPENETGQVVLSLGLIRGSGERWQDLKDKRDSGEPVEVRAMEVNRGGVIADFSGLRGFIPTSQLDQTAARNPKNILGKNLQVVVLDVDEEQGKIIFSQKQATSASDLSAKRQLLEKLEIGSTYSGIVSSVMLFGIFVKLNDPPVEGLVHLSEISWEKVADPQKLFKVGDSVEVLVLNCDLHNLKLSLSIKQLQKSPWGDIEEKYSKEQEVKGKVTRLTNFGAFVELEDNVEGLIHISKIPPEVGFKEGDIVDCLIESIDGRARKISLVPILKKKPVAYR